MRFNLAALVLTAACYALISFKTTKFNDDVFATIGISASQANEKISSSILNGYMQTWGIKNVKNIAAGNRAAVAMDLLSYTKKYLSSDDFARLYAAEKENHKPSFPPVPATPEAYRKELIDQAKQTADDAQKYYDNATAEDKTTFKSSLDDAKKYLEDLQKPDNEFLKYYADNYSTTLEYYKKDSASKAAKWQEKYPDNAMLFVKKRLEEFMTATADVDFNAATVERNGKLYFADQKYEAKNNKWKMAFRAGSDVVQTSRTFVQQWINEIK
ncbi:hypothetical protein [Parafilimonas terrae]|nr:hypothetical protein [Parafilimonas terrae]